MMTLSDYDALRADGNRFASKPGHELPEVEAVVDANDYYVDRVEVRGRRRGDAIRARL